MAEYSGLFAYYRKCWPARAGRWPSTQFWEVIVPAEPAERGNFGTG